MLNKIKYILILILSINLTALSRPLDSLRTEIINGQRFIIHEVKRGETAEIIAKRYNSNLNSIIKNNNLKDNKLSKKQILKIPIQVVDTNKLSIIKADSSSINDAHANASGKELAVVYTHTVVSGETINNIAKKYKVSVAQITRWNSLKGNKVNTGQVLIVNEGASIKPFFRLNKTEAQLPTAMNKPKLANVTIKTDTGMAIYEEAGTILHATAPIGSLIRITNLENNQECLVKVTGKISQDKYTSFMIVLDINVQKKLKTSSAVTKVKLEYL
jgi:LysM repeat protein